jgi:large subunit ribosomal protein L2
MGKNLAQQARGKGGPTYRAPSFNYAGEAKLFPLRRETQNLTVVDIIHCPGHSAPLLKVKDANGEEGLMIASENVRVGETVSIGSDAEMKHGNTMPLNIIPEGTLIFNIELMPGDGGRFVRASGTYAKIVTQSKEGVTVLLPSKKQRLFNPNCRASIGIVAAGNRTEKPFMKAGLKYFAMKARNRYWPSVSGASQNAVDHPFGGSSSSRKGRPTIAPKNAPPGRKVGMLHPRHTGRNK